MLGNAWELVADCWRDALSDAPANTACEHRPTRGGSWNDYPRDLRSAKRSRVVPSYRGSATGFRIARSLP